MGHPATTRPRGDEDSAGSRRRPRILGLGGTMRAGSTSERALRLALDCAERLGACTDMLAAEALDIPMYTPVRTAHGDRAERLLGATAAADGLIISSPAYHGGISGMIKNALDYVEDLRDDARPYLHGRAVGCIVCADGRQATATALVSLRSVVHALRGWPTPLGAVLNSSELGVDGAGPDVVGQLSTLAGQVVDFTQERASAPFRTER